jgi:hypothetical protein
MMVVECFFRFRQPQALWGESVVRKYWARSVWGVVGGQADVAMWEDGMVSFQDDGVWISCG